MPIKKVSNHLMMVDDKNHFVLNFFTHNKKAHFCSESKLYDEVKTAIYFVSPFPICYLTTYPFIAVHILHGEEKLLNDNKERFRLAIETTLDSCIVK